MARRGAAALALLALGAGAAGCGAEEGASSGATVAVYVSAPQSGPEAREGRRMCREATAQARRQGSRAGDLRLRVRCLDASGPDGAWTLTRVGANARAATEDSTTVAYVGEPDRRARAQSAPIVEAAEIAALGGLSGTEAMRQVIAAIEGDEAPPRVAVFEDPGVDHGA